VGVWFTPLVAAFVFYETVNCQECISLSHFSRCVSHDKLMAHSVFEHVLGMDTQHRREYGRMIILSYWALESSIPRFIWWRVLLLYLSSNHHNHLPMEERKQCLEVPLLLDLSCRSCRSRCQSWFGNGATSKQQAPVQGIARERQRYCACLLVSNDVCQLNHISPLELWTLLVCRYYTSYVPIRLGVVAVWRKQNLLRLTAVCR